MVVCAQLDQAGIEQNLAAAPFQYDCLEIVVENRARLAVPGLKSMHVTAPKVLHRLVEEELQLEGARIGQRHYKAGQGPAGMTHHDVTEVGPVNMSLLTGKGLQAQKRLADRGAQAGDRTPQLD